MQSPARARGVTLTELLVVVVIIGILAAIAVPAYQNHFRRARETTARGCLQQLATRFERYQQQFGSYPTAFSQLGFTGETTESRTYCQDNSSTSEPTDYWYNLNPTALDTGCTYGFTLSAVSQATRTSDRKTINLAYCFGNDPKDRIRIY